MSRYAANTQVSSERSRLELEKILKRYGADQLMYGEDAGKVVIAFRMSDRMVRFILPLPDPDDPEFTEYMRGGWVHQRTPEAVELVGSPADLR